MRPGLARCLLPLLAAVPMLVAAEGALDTRLRDQLRQTILELRQLQDENARLKSQLNAAPARPAADPEAEQRLRRAVVEAGRLSTQGALLAQELDSAKAQIAELNRRLDSASAEGRAAQGRERQIGAELAAQRASSASCESHNAELVALGRELVDRYHARGFTDVLLDREPLTGVHRIRFETLVQTYESRLREQRVTPPPAPNPATADASSP